MGNNVSQSNKKVRQPVSPTLKDNNEKHLNNLLKSVESNKQTSGLTSENDKQAASKCEPNGEIVYSKVIKKINKGARVAPATPNQTLPGYFIRWLKRYAGHYHFDIARQWRP